MDVSYNEGDNEALIFVIAMTEFLIKAKWKQVPWTGGGLVSLQDNLENFDLIPTLGVLAYSNKRNEDKLSRPADALSSSLYNAKIMAFS